MVTAGGEFALGGGQIDLRAALHGTSHFMDKLNGDEGWMDRIGAIRANASRCSHAELDEAEELDAGNPKELAADYRTITDRFSQIKVLGGCCGTDHRHIVEISAACKEAA